VSIKKAAKQRESPTQSMNLQSYFCSFRRTVEKKKHGNRQRNDAALAGSDGTRVEDNGSREYVSRQVKLLRRIGQIV